MEENITFDADEFLSDIRYYWNEKGDIERYTGYSLEKLREADPVIAKAYVDCKMAKEVFTRLLNSRSSDTWGRE